MATACIPQVTFQGEGFAKPVVAHFDMPHASSDGGAVLLKGLDTQLQLTKRLAACVTDARQPGKVQHQTLELLRQRVFGIACGYADCNDAARLADDAIHMSTVGQGEPPRVAHGEPVRRDDRTVVMGVRPPAVPAGRRSASWCARPGSWRPGSRGSGRRG